MFNRQHFRWEWGRPYLPLQQLATSGNLWLSLYIYIISLYIYIFIHTCCHAHIHISKQSYLSCNGSFEKFPSPFRAKSNSQFFVHGLKGKPLICLYNVTWFYQYCDVPFFLIVTVITCNNPYLPHPPPPHEWTTSPVFPIGQKKEQGPGQGKGRWQRPQAR